MKHRLPGAILERRKHGFQVPLDRWFRTELKALVSDVLAPDRIDSQGYFQSAFVEQLLKEHFEGTRNHSEKIFSLLVLGLWYDRWMRN